MVLEVRIKGGDKETSAGKVMLCFLAQALIMGVCHFVTIYGAEHL